MKHILIIGLLLIVLPFNANAGMIETYCWDWNDKEGVYKLEGEEPQLFYYGAGESLYIKYYITALDDYMTYYVRRVDTIDGCTYSNAIEITHGDYTTNFGKGAVIIGTFDIYNVNYYEGLYVSAYSLYTDPDGSIIFIVANTSFTDYTISGITDCVSSVALQIYDTATDTYTELETNSTEGAYTFTVSDNFTYKLIFSPDMKEYVFTVNGSDIEYDYDACSHTKYRFEESCGNLIPDSEGGYFSYEPDIIHAIQYYAPTGILDISNSSATHFEIFTNTFIGATGWVIDPVVSNNTYTLENSNIAWGLKVIVQNESDGSLIDGVAVMVNQSCYCTDGYSTRNKRTVNGMVEYGDMSLQDASIHVTKHGYKFLDENSTGYNVFLSGRSNFSSKTWIIKLAPSSSNNSSEWHEVGNKVDIHFRDIDGNRTSQILDTDANVYLYYENNNTDGEAMTLRFESSSTHTYFTPEQTWTIAHDTIGYKTIGNSYFTPWDYSYRAVIYNSSIYGWNITIPLTVRNDTRETEGHYENLTTNLWFRYEQDGKVDFRDDMEIVSHANSNNTTLMTIDLELWKDGVLLCYKNLTASDYAAASYPYYYVWEPSYDYITGSNYSIRMYGYDRTLLETAYVDCVSDETTRKNKLTIGVKDRAGNNLDNAYIYLEGWGSLPTGNTYYNAYEGIDNADYRYKATKSGYTGVGWNEVNISDGDKIVWYTLTSDYTNASVASQKFDDEDIKEFFFPLMYFLFICIILGGLRYVTK